jgi:hypothetical protein
MTQKRRMNQTKLADTLYSKIIRSRGPCIAAGQDRAVRGTRFGCSQTLQCAHVVSRTYRAVRWRTDDPPGAVPLCGAHHVWYTHHPLEWIAFMGDHYDAVRELALTTPPENAGDALARLRQLDLEEDPV